MFGIKVVNEYYNPDTSYSSVARYIRNTDKTNGLYGGYGLFTATNDDVAKTMRICYNTRNTNENVSCLFHVVAFFKIHNTEENVLSLFQCAQQAAYIIGLEHQVFFGVHFKDDSAPNPNEKLHIHFEINAVKWTDGEVIRNNDSGRGRIRALVYRALAQAVSSVQLL